MASVWDNEELEKEVIHLWNEEGWSALVISKHVNAKYGKELLSRNSVVAKAHRLRAQGVKMRGRPLVRGSRVVKVRKVRARSPSKMSTGRPNGQQAPTRLALAIRAAPFKASVDTLTPTVFSVGDLEANHCRWVYSSSGEPGFGFCGRDKFMGLSYCDAHATKAYQSPAVRNTEPVPLLTAHEKKERQLV